MTHLKRLPGTEMVAVCDVYEPRLLQAAEIAGPAASKVPITAASSTTAQIDAVADRHTRITGTRRSTLDAVAAGKDVYVEKPVSHTIAEGVEMVKAVEASKQIVQTGTQQRSWDHWVLGKQLIDSGRLGQITFVQTYWYQHSRAGNYAPVSMDKLDWKAWLGSAADRPFQPERFYQWRHFWDYGGGCITDLMTHWIDVVHWYMDVDAPLSAVATDATTTSSSGKRPTRSTRRWNSPRNSWRPISAPTSARSTMAGWSSAGAGTLKIDRARLAFYRDDAAYAPGTLTPEPEIYVRSSGDGSVRTCRTGWTASAAASRRPRPFVSDTQRRERRTSPTPRCAARPSCALESVDG